MGEGGRVHTPMKDDIERRLQIAARLWDWQPHPGQRELLTLRLDDGSEPRVLVAACGRRWGKTECIGMDIASRLLTDPELGQMAVAPTRDQAETLFDCVEEKITAAKEDAGALEEFPHLRHLEVKRWPYPQIRRADTGATVFSARTAARTGRNLRGKGTTRRVKRFRVILDERAFIPDEAVESAIKPMLATVPGGGQLVEISSPFGRRGGFFEDYGKGERKEGRYRAVRLPSSQNPLVDPEFLAEMQEEMTERAFRTEFLAEFLDAAGVVFPEADLLAAVCEDDYGMSPLWGRRYVAGIDFGRRGDWTVAAILEVGGGSGMRLVELLRLQGLEWSGQLDRVTDALSRWGIRRAAADGTGLGDPLVEELRRKLTEARVGCEVERFVFTGASKGPLIDALSIALSRRRLRFPAHPVLLSEMRNFEATPATSPGGREKMAAAKGHDDCVCALALAVHAAGPLLERAGGAVVIGTGEKRTVFQPASKEEEINFTWRHGYPGSGAGTRARLPLKERLLEAAYRFDCGRRAGGFLARRSR